MNDMFAIDLGPDLQKTFRQRPYVYRSMGLFMMSALFGFLLYDTISSAETNILTNFFFWLSVISLLIGCSFFFQNISVEVKEEKIKISYFRFMKQKTLDEPLSNYVSVVAATMNPVNWLGQKKKQDDYMIALRHKNNSLSKDVVIYFGDQSLTYNQYKEKYPALLNLTLEDVDLTEHSHTKSPDQY